MWHLSHPISNKNPHKKNTGSWKMRWLMAFIPISENYWKLAYGSEMLWDAFEYIGRKEIRAYPWELKACWQILRGNSSTTKRGTDFEVVHYKMKLHETFFFFIQSETKLTTKSMVTNIMVTTNCPVTEWQCARRFYVLCLSHFQVLTGPSFCS